ncbi:MAG TPA: oligoendopeptidase, partial [Bacillota bacterium]|nr:oligoendopeptidase [Bacillota bacterium]
MTYNDTWDLESIIPGGTNSPQLKEKLDELQVEVKSFADSLHKWEIEENAQADMLKSLLEKQEAIGKGLGQSATFVQMWHDAFMDDEHASVTMGRVMDIFSDVKKLSNTFTKKLVAIPDVKWEEMLQDPELAKTSFVLNEHRDEGKRLLSEEEEKLIADLNNDGLSGWSKLYDTTVSIMTIPFEEKDGKKVELSIGQAMNRMYADPDPDVRKRLFESWEIAWKKMAPVFADTINHLSGYRLTLQKAHGREDHLEEPLEYNRMTQETLDAMWGAVSNHKKPFTDYL